MDLDRITGVMIQYYYTCKRELWFFGNGINLNQSDQNILIGRQIQKNYYKDRNKNLLVDGMISVDMVEGGNSIVEIKKSSKMEKPAKKQLKYYMWYLEENKGVQVKGIMAYPEERGREEVELTTDDRREFEKAVNEIRKIIEKDRPPASKKKQFCKNCSYYDLCWV